ncbi:ras-related protein Rap-1b-like [Scylla paramamosain]|uniref:ras-related protein Rap-1b-like n=1 Tax=Scylla paramamosain TaxID=85552 RepID=UPI003082D551
MKENKLVILGGGGVGKTSLVLQFLQGIFSPVYRPTVEDCYSHTLQMPSGLFQALEILDTSGTHCFPAMRELSIRSGRAFLLVFAVNSQQSFYEAQALWSLIRSVKDVDNIPGVLVGNKVDVAGEREVSWEEAHSFAVEHMHYGAYLETSAKFNLNVDLVFKELLILAFGLGKDEALAPRWALCPASLLTMTPRPSPSAASILHHHHHQRGSFVLQDNEEENRNNTRLYHSLVITKEKCNPPHPTPPPPKHGSSYVSEVRGFEIFLRHSKT